MIKKKDAKEASKNYESMLDGKVIVIDDEIYLPINSREIHPKSN